MMKWQARSVFAVVTLLLSSVVSGADSDIVVTHSNIGGGMAPYVGISLGSADYDLANDSSPSFSIFGGIALNELLAVELGVVDFGDAGIAPTAREASAFYGSVVANVSLSNELTAFAQIGLASWDYNVGAVSDTSVDVFLGGGLNYEIDRHLSARFAIQQFSIDANVATIAMEDNILNVNIGLIYHF